MLRNIMIVSDLPDSTWPRQAVKVLQPLGNVKIKPEAHAEVNTKVEYGLIIIDVATLKNDVIELISRLHQAWPTIPIVVVTASPTWRRARESMLAGASDYIRKSFDAEILLASCQKVLERFGPPSSMKGKSNGN